MQQSTNSTAELSISLITKTATLYAPMSVPKVLAGDGAEGVSHLPQKAAVAAQDARLVGEVACNVGAGCDGSGYHQRLFIARRSL